MIARQIDEDGMPQYDGSWWTLALPGPILAVHLALVSALWIWAVRRAATSSGWIVVGVGSGLALWTPFEYALHRWVLHHTAHPLLRRIFWQALHKEHHGYRTMKDPDHHGVHLAITVPMALTLVGLVAVTTTGGMGLAMLSGWLLGYCSYEALHWQFHGGNPDGALGRLSVVRRLWDAHTCHHLHRADANFGFVTTFWDRTLQTFCETRSGATSGLEPRSGGNHRRDR